MTTLGMEAFHKLILPILLALFIGFACDGSKEPSLREGFEGGRYRNVVAFGDSIVKGYRVTRGWPKVLEESLSRRYPQIRIMNAGQAGDTAADGLSRLERDVLRYRPDLVLVAFGLNDMRYKLPAEAFRKDLEGIIDTLEESDAEVILLTTTRLARGVGLINLADPGPYNEVIRELADHRNLFLIDVYKKAADLNRSEYMLDAAHPNQKGYLELARIIEGAMIH